VHWKSYSDEPVRDLFCKWELCNEECQYANIMNIVKTWTLIKAGVRRLMVVLRTIRGKPRQKRIRNQTIKDIVRYVCRTIIS
jgi:hypothetical protein